MTARLNLYTCQKCHGQIVTVDLVEGTTPFMLICRASEHDANLWAGDDYLDMKKLKIVQQLSQCGGMMHSSFYRMPVDAPTPTWEWYRPNDSEYRRLSPIMREDHVDNGGLLIRQITDEGRKAAGVV